MCSNNGSLQNTVQPVQTASHSPFSLTEKHVWDLQTPWWILSEKESCFLLTIRDTPTCHCSFSPITQTIYSSRNIFTTKYFFKLTLQDNVHTNITKLYKFVKFEACTFIKWNYKKLNANARLYQKWMSQELSSQNVDSVHLDVPFSVGEMFSYSFKCLTWMIEHAINCTLYFIHLV